jgi:hypothetical protein
MWHWVHEQSSDVSRGDAAFAEIAKSIRERTPEQNLYAPRARPTWAIAVQPSLGPRTLYLGRRAVTAVMFWGTPELEAQFQDTLRALLERDEARSLALLRSLTARYVLLDDFVPYFPFMLAAAGEDRLGYPPEPSAARAELRRSLWYRLYHRNGLALPNGAAALGRFRLVATAGRGPTMLKLFERVEGAELVGSAPPRSTVELRGTIRTSGSQDWTYVDRSAASEEGRFHFRIPYATRASQRVGYASSFTLGCPHGVRRHVAVTPSAVLNGETITADCVSN